MKEVFTPALLCGDYAVAAVDAAAAALEGALGETSKRAALSQCCKVLVSYKQPNNQGSTFFSI